ncbi:MAG: hypothetical protein JSW12_17645 [Deltaproteobacteria bacterium]|nr:MAG: hypothetical protein JSW12_17645 [Deltaproteobacteria bacterium]
MDKNELEFVKQALAKREGLQYIQIIEHIRVPTVLPTPGKKGVFEEEVVERMQVAVNSLVRVGIKNDVGSQVTWVMPKETHWGVVFQLAIYEVTGFAPYLVQRWRYEGDQLVRGNIRLIDGHGLISEKD